MSSTPEGATEARYRLLLVGESEPVQQIRDRLRRGFGEASITSVPTPSDALDRASDTDCLVCEPGSVAILADATASPIVAITAGDGSSAIDAGAVDVLSPTAAVSVARARIRTVVGGAQASRTRDRVDRYRAIFDASTAVVLVTDGDGTIRWASPATDRTIDYTPAELEGDELGSIVHPDDRATVTDRVESIAEAEHDDRARVTCRIRLGSGRIGRYAIDIRNRLSDPALSALVCTFRPADEETTADAASSAIPDRRDGRAGDIDDIDDPVVRLDRDWVVTSANRAAATALSPRPDEPPTGHEFWELLPAETLPTWFEELSAARAREAAVTFDVPVADGDGFYAVTAYPGDESVTVLAHRRAETVASKARADLDATASVLDAVPTPAFLVENGRISIANAATFDYTDRDAVVGQRLESILDEPVASAVARRASASIRRVDPIEWTPPAGTADLTVELSVVPLGDDRAAVVGADVTRRHRLTASLSALTDAVGSLRERATVDPTREVLTAGIRAAFDTAVAVWYTIEDGQLTPRRSAGLADGTQPPPLSTTGSWFSSITSGEPTALGTDERIPLGAGAEISNPIAIPIGDGAVVIAGDTDRGDRDAGAGAARDADPGDVTTRSRPPGEPDRSDTPRPATDPPPGMDHRDGDEGSPPGSSFDRRGDSRIEPIGGLIAEVAPLSLARASCLGENRDLSAALDRAETFRERVETVADRRSAVNHALRTAETRSALESSLCRELAELEAVDFAIIARLRDSAIDLRAHAGTVPARLADDPARESTLVGPIVTAAADGRQVVESIEAPAGDRLADHVDSRSVIATPIAGTNRTYGILGVYASSDAPVDILSTFCADVATGGFLAIDAIETREALLADDVVALELSIPPTGDDVIPSLARNLDTRIDVDAVARGDEESTLYVTIHDSSETGAEAEIEALRGVRATRRLRAGDERASVEVTVDRQPLLDTITAYDGVITTVTARDEATVLRVELPVDRDVRSLVEAVQGIAPDTELRARRPISRADRSANHREILTELTDRQREILRTAYAAGYFEFPRERTGEEIAAQLDISQPTFTRHFRAAERTVFTALFGE